MNSVLSEARSCLYPSEARGEEVGLSQECGDWRRSSLLPQSWCGRARKNIPHPPCSAGCKMELFHLVKRGAEVCFWEEILAPSKELGGSGQVGKVMSVCLQGVPN